MRRREIKATCKERVFFSWESNYDFLFANFLTQIQYDWFWVSVEKQRNGCASNNIFSILYLLKWTSYTLEKLKEKNRFNSKCIVNFNVALKLNRFGWWYKFEKFNFDHIGWKKWDQNERDICGNEGDNVKNPFYFDVYSENCVKNINVMKFPENTIIQLICLRWV